MKRTAKEKIGVNLYGVYRSIRKNRGRRYYKACIELQAASDKLEIQVISEGSSGFFGIGSKPAVIRAAVKAAPEKEPEAPQKPEKKRQLLHR